MFLSPGEIVGGIRYIVDVVDKVKENKEELQRLSNRLQYVMTSLEEARERNELQPAEYQDALTVIASLVERSQRITRRILKRSLGDRTWRRDDIALEIKRITADVDTYLNVHVVKTLDVIQSTNAQAFTTLSSSVEEIMIKLAEIDIRLRTPNTGDSAQWSSPILSQARQNISTPVTSNVSPANRRIESDSNTTDITPDLRVGHHLASSSHTSLQVSGLKTPNGQVYEDPVTIPNVNIRSSYEDVLEAIRKAGYVLPTDLTGEALMMNTADVDQFDATMPGGLKISRETPILTWWCKYREFHGIAPGTTPGHTLAELAESNGEGGTTAVLAGGVKIRFHRTLRVPDSLDANRLPVDLGRFPLLPVAKFAHRLPESIRSRGGFFMPMFEREALFISFEAKKSWERFAVKVSTGGVNVLTGVFKNVHDAQVREQDYIVAGLQPWIDGAMTEEGVVRQFVAMSHGGNYTIEEQVTDKAEEGGFQFDIFPRRPKPHNGRFYEFNMRFETPRGRASGGRKLQLLKTPAELGVPDGAIIGFYDVRHWPVRSEHEWTVGAYQQRIGNFPLIATYGRIGIGGMLVGYLPPEPKIRTLETVDPSNKMITPMGIGLGGKISQKIYKDELPPRVYDEEKGHRFHVHIISADVWETVTGVLPPITPITPATYQAHNLPWFTLSDQNATAITPKTDRLGTVKSITQIDREKVAAQEDQVLPAAEALIDPDHPPSCSVHAKILAQVVFRPCGHTACSGCLGQAMLKRSKCPCCSKQISKFVGMKEPVAGFEPAEIDDTWVDDSEAAWNVKIADIEHGEMLAARAVTQGKIVVIHLEEDRVSPLYSNDPTFGVPPTKSPQAPAALAPAQASSSAASKKLEEDRVSPLYSNEPIPPTKSPQAPAQASSSAVSNKLMTIFINLPFSYAVNGQTKISLDIEPSATVLKMKEIIQEKTGCPAEDQRPIFHGWQLNDDTKTVADHKIKKEDTITLITKMRR
ncbi:hypothetical protein DFH08DRAFT_292628 [Mycena albidolilacea]|uniref:Ubiquitin-like domain-containing protein n=1 Tax=Mycena albidolilacea TaxID=1033008 RepID=A0AAD7EKN0_9AGAR|nr:hypothetical protein DFH08DRAFT_292628 [Mycena albidolilacea]